MKNSTITFGFYTLILTAVFSLLTVLPLSNTSTTYAQQSLQNTSSSYIELLPRYPTPGQSVKATFVAHSIDVSTAFITWTINGKVYEKSFSGKTITFTVGDVGSIVDIQATAEDGGNGYSQASTRVRVSDISVLWEANSYVPPFYKGKALQGPGSDIRAVAIAEVSDKNGNLYKPEDLSYIWTTNRSSVPEVSGRGMHSVTLANKYPQQNLFVNVQVKDPAGDVRVIKNFEVPPSSPVVLLYEESPSVGVRYDRSVQSELSIFDREVTLVAEPYFMSATSRTDQVLEYAWDIDNNVNNTKGSLSFSPAENSAVGIAYLDLTVNNTKQWLQNGRAKVMINFGSHSQWGGAVNFE